MGSAHTEKDTADGGMSTEIDTAEGPRRWQIRPHDLARGT
jgi:hypothetical protein